MQHRSKRCDPCAGGDEKRIPHGRTQDEITERPLARDFVTFFHVAKIIRGETILHPVQAERETVAIGRRRDRIGARDFLSVNFRVGQRQPLPGNKPKSRRPLDFEFKMPGEFGQASRVDQTSREPLKLNHKHLDDTSNHQEPRRDRHPRLSSPRRFVPRQVYRCKSTKCSTWNILQVCNSGD